MDWPTLKETVISLYDKLHTVHLEYFHVWKEAIVFTWRWWAALALIVIPWIIWFSVRKRDSSDRLLYAGAVIAILASLMDMVGVTLHLWSYPVTVFPLMPSYVPFDLSALPVATMLWLQFLPKMKLVLKALIYAAVGAFVFEPLCDWIGLALQTWWLHILTFIMLFGLYHIAYWFSKRKNFNPVS